MTSRRIRRFTPSGEPLAPIDLSATVGELGWFTFDRTGRLFVVDSSVPRVVIFDKTGAPTASFTIPIVGPMAVDRDGTVFIVSWTEHVLMRFTPGAGPAPTPTVTVTPTPTQTVGPYTPLSIPGRIEAEDYDLGGEGIGPASTTAGNSGGTYRTDDVDIEYTASEGNHNVGSIRDGEWLAYTADVTGSGPFTVTARVASPNTGRQATLAVDGVMAATIAVPDAGS